LPPQTTQAVSDGNWVFLKPLPVGNHTIYFKGGLRNITDVKGGNHTFADPYGWDYSNTYHNGNRIAKVIHIQIRPVYCLDC
jgi:hypothetical protein